MEEFNTFVELMELMDDPRVGNRFTWVSSDDNDRSKLDIFIVSEGIIDCWKITLKEIISIDISNHSPVWVKASDLNWGPKPFKVNMC